MTVQEIVTAFVHVFAMMAPWLVFGFLMAGIIAVWIPRSWVNRAMGGSTGLRGILRAVAIGVPLPICSCGVLPIAAGHALSVVHWASALFLAAMMIYNFVHPVQMGHQHRCACK